MMGVRADQRRRSMPDKRLLSPADFAEAVGVTTAVVQSRLNGPQGDYWREALRVVFSGADGTGQMRIPATSVALWRRAMGPKSRRRGSVKTRTAAQGREQAIRPARPGLNEALMALPRRAETVDRDVLRRTFVDVGQLAHLLTSPTTRSSSVAAAPARPMPWRW